MKDSDGFDAVVDAANKWLDLQRELREHSQGAYQPEEGFAEPRRVAHNAHRGDLVRRMPDLHYLIRDDTNPSGPLWLVFDEESETGQAIGQGATPEAALREALEDNDAG